MKKNLFKMAFFAAFMTAFSTSYALDAVVTSVTGNAKYKNSQGAWDTVKVGTKLAKGDAVQTGFKSEVVLKIGETTAKIGSVANVTVENLRENGDIDETTLYLNAGKVKSDVKKVDKRRVGFTVRSPAATASVRGTKVDVATKYKGTDIRTHRGSVKVSKTTNKPLAEGSADPAGSYYVNEGQAASITLLNSSDPQKKAKENSLTLNSVPNGADSEDPSNPLLQNSSSAQSATLVIQALFTD